MRSRIKHIAKRLLGRSSGPPPVQGVADAEWYDAAYRASESYAEPFWQSHYYFLWSVIADRVRAAKARRVLDIGCGPGQFAACLFDLVEIDAYTGLDFSKQAVQMAKRVCPRGEYHVGDATTTTIHDDVPHDVVVCTEVLEHVPTDFAVIHRFRPGMRCLCTVPNFPYQSHVRHFESVGQVSDRYARLFDKFDVWAVKRSNSQVFFLMDGIRNTVMD